MTVCIPFFAGDAKQAQDLLLWISQLGGVKQHDCLLVVDCATPWPELAKIRDLAGQAFKSVKVTANAEHVDGWIPGSNSLFEAAARQCAGQPFFWCEPDCIPLKPNWLDELEFAYASCDQDFMGTIVNHANAKWPNPYFEGCAVYPLDAWERLKPFWNPLESWTRACVKATIPNAIHTDLIHFLWGERENAPTFASKAVCEIGIFDLSCISPKAVVWHRSKDGTLIRLLRQRAGIAVEKEPGEMMVVFPFCNKDVHPFVQNVRWMGDLEGKYPYDAVLSYDYGTSANAVQLMKVAVTAHFRTVHTNAYPIPVAGQWAPTMAFIAAAKFMAERFKRPWLWMEYDLIPLKRGWLKAMEAEYWRAGKPFMAPQVPEMLHYNGTGIYPPNTPDLLRVAFTHTETAWDVAGKSEMIGKTHNCADLLQHVWGVVNGRLHPYQGEPPSFHNGRLMFQISPRAVLFHRCKDLSLINQLRARRR